MKLRILLSLALLNLAIQAFAHREATYYLQARINDLDFYIQLDEYGDACMARYFTSADTFDHVMEGVIIDSGRFELSSYILDQGSKERKITGTMSLREYELNKWKGSWDKQDGSIEEFELRPILIDSLQHPFERVIKKYRISPYAAARTKNLSFSYTGKKRLSRGKYIELNTDSYINYEYFRIRKHDKYLPRVDSINDRLIADHIGVVEAYYSCTFMGKKGEYHREFEIDFLNKHLISYTIRSQSSCFGREEPEISYHQNLSMNSADPLMIEDIYWFAEKPAPELIEGESKWFQYRYKYFGKKILEIMEQRYPSEFVSGKENGCDYSSVRVWQFPSWHLTWEGIYLGSKSAASNKKCDSPPWAIIPYHLLKDYEVQDFGLSK